MDNDDVRNPVILCTRREIKLNGTLKVVVAQQSEDTSSKATFVCVAFLFHFTSQISMSLSSSQDSLQSK